MSTPLASGETFLQNYQGLGKYICDLFSLRRFVLISGAYKFTKLNDLLTVHCDISYNKSQQDALFIFNLFH